MNKIYRPCAGIVVFNNDGLLFLGNRVGIENSWQFPQGGIEKNETILEAAKRELFEETGIKSVIHIYTEDVPIRYEFNEKIKSNFRKKGIFNDGQEIYFSLFYFNGSDSEINLKVFEQEFDKFNERISLSIGIRIQFSGFLTKISSGMPALSLPNII